MAKVGDQFQTKKGTDSLAVYTANANLMYNEQANAIAVKRAALNAKVEGAKYINAESANVIRNPAMLPLAEKNAEEFGATLTGVSPEQRAEIVSGLKKELNQAAAISASRIDPKGTKQKLEAGEWDLTPEGRAVAISKAEQEGRMQEADQARIKAEARVESMDRAERAYDGHFKTLMDGKPNDSSWHRAVMDDPAFATHPEKREHLIMLAKALTKELNGGERKSDPVAYRDAWLRITRGEITDSAPIADLVEAHRLNVHDGQFLTATVQQAKDPNGQTVLSKMRSLVGIFGQSIEHDVQFTGQASTVAAIQMDYMARVTDQVNSLRAAGKDPQLAFDPTSKDYVGDPKFGEQSIKNVRERMAAKGRQIGTPIVKSEDDLLAVPAGEYYRDSQGNTRLQSPETLRVVNERRAASKAEQDRANWMQETGGTLRPGETQAQAFERWKAARGR